MVMATVNEKMTAIADAIRDKTGDVDALSLDDMTVNISKVYEAGRKDEHKLCWEAIQRQGTRTDYGFAFKDWRSEWFYPIYDMVIAEKAIASEPLATSMFRGFNNIGGSSDFDLSARLEECGVVLDTSKCPNFLYFMLSIKAKRVPKIDLSNSTSSATYMTFYATQIQIIDGLVFSENTNIASNTFDYSSKLTTISNVEGVIAKSINFQYSPLNVETMKRIILHLKNYAGTTNELKYTVKFTTACWEALEADSTSPTGTTWADYVFSLGWNT